MVGEKNKHNTNNNNQTGQEKTTTSVTSIPLALCYCMCTGYKGSKQQNEVTWMASLESLKYFTVQNFDNTIITASKMKYGGRGCWYKSNPIGITINSLGDMDITQHFVRNYRSKLWILPQKRIKTALLPIYLDLSIRISDRVSYNKQAERSMR